MVTAGLVGGGVGDDDVDIVGDVDGDMFGDINLKICHVGWLVNQSTFREFRPNKLTHKQPVRQ